MEEPCSVRGAHNDRPAMAKGPATSMRPEQGLLGSTGLTRRYNSSGRTESSTRPPEVIFPSCGLSKIQQSRKHRKGKRQRLSDADEGSQSSKIRKLDDFTVAEFKLLVGDSKTAFEDPMQQTIMHSLTWAISILRRACKWLPKGLTLLAYQALIRSHLEYASTLFVGVANTHCEKLERLQRVAARIICAAANDAHAEPLLTSLDLDTLTSRRNDRAIGIINSILQGLQKYLDQVKKYEQHDSSLDITAGYCLTTNEFSEILSLVSNIGSYSNKEVHLVFDCLQNILTRVADDLKKHKLVAQSIVRCILSSAMGSVFYQLSVKNKSMFTKSALKLLTAIVQHADWAAREVITRLDMTQPNFQQLLNCKDLRDTEDVKMYLIRFLSALLLTADKTVYKVLLANKVFWSTLFSLLHGDKAECIVFILELLLQTVVNNEVVSKTTKIYLFNEQSLGEISRLFYWSGPKKWNETLTNKKQKAADKKDETKLDILSLSEEQSLVRETVHKFLVDLCCSHRLGICFQDKSYGTSSQNSNHVLTGFLNGLHQKMQKSLTSEDPLQAELISSILKSCPDQLTHFLPALRYSSVPRPTDSWLACTHFLHRVYSDQSLISSALKVRYTVSAEVLVSMIMSTLIPHKDVWSNYCNAIKKPWMSVVDESLAVLNVVLRRLEATLEAVEGYMTSDDQESGMSDSDVIISDRTEYLKECLNILRSTAAAALPDLETIVECWENVMGDTEINETNSATSPRKKIKQKKIESKDKLTDNVVDVLPKKTMTEYLNTTITTLRLYCTLFPRTIQLSASLEYSNLLRGIEASRSEVESIRIKLDSEADAEERKHVEELIKISQQVQIETLRLLACSNVRLNELLVKAQGNQCALSSLLSMASTVNEQESSSILQLINKLLMSSGLFENMSDELGVWLSHVTGVNHSNHASSIQFFVSCVETYVNSPYTWIDEIIKAQVSAYSGSMSGKKSKPKNKATKSDLLQVIADGLEIDLLDACTYEANKKEKSRLPFSALVPIALDKLKSTDVSDSQRNDMKEVFSTLMSQQTDNNVLSKLLQDNGITVSESFKTVKDKTALNSDVKDASKLTKSQSSANSSNVDESTNVDKESSVEKFISSHLQKLLQQINADTETKENIIQSLEKALKESTIECAQLRNTLSASGWNSFIRLGLKNHYTSVEFLQMVGLLVEVLYKDKEIETEEESRLKITEIHGMIISHSMFIPTLLNENSDSNVKDAVITLLLRLCTLDSTCCNAKHLPVLLSSYTASMSKTDQKTLSLMQLYDQQENNKSLFKPYMWGEKAAEYQTGKKHLGVNLWKEPTMDQILELLEEQKLQYSMLNFPLQRSLKDKSSLSTSVYQYNDVTCYDPAFLLPLFSCITEPQYVVNCVKFVEQNCLGFVISALSAHNSGLRSLAYHVLTQFHAHVEGSRILGKAQLLAVFEILRNSLRKKNDKLPCMISLFLAKACHIAITPGSEMFLPIMSFLSLKPSLDLHNVPEFYKLFYSSELSYKVERSWLIGLMIEGLRETSDYHVCERRYVYKILMSFYDTTLCDQYMRIQILRFLTKSCSVRSVAWDLIKNHSLLSYISAISCRRADSSSSQAAVEQSICSVLTTLWQTLSEMFERRRKQTQDKIECLPPSLVAELILTCRTVIANFGLNCLPAVQHSLTELIKSCQLHVEKIDEMCNTRGFINPIPAKLTTQLN